MGHLEEDNVRNPKPILSSEHNQFNSNYVLKST